MICPNCKAGADLRATGGLDDPGMNSKDHDLDARKRALHAQCAGVGCTCQHREPKGN